MEPEDETLLATEELATELTDDFELLEDDLILLSTEDFALLATELITEDRELLTLDAKLLEAALLAAPPTIP